MSTWLTNSLQRAGELLESVDQKAAVKLKPIADDRSRKTRLDGCTSAVHEDLTCFFVALDAKRHDLLSEDIYAKNLDPNTDYPTTVGSSFQPPPAVISPPLIDIPESDTYSEWSEVENESNSGLIMEEMPLSSSSSRSLAPLQSPPNRAPDLSKADATRLRKENAKLKADLTTCERQLATSQERLHVCEEELEALDKECVAKIQSLENDIARIKLDKAADEDSFRTALALKDAHAQSLQAELDKSRTAITAMHVDLEAARRALAEIRNNKDQAWTQAASGEARVHERLLSAQTELQEALAVAAALKREHADTKQSMFARQCQLEATNAELTQAVAALERQLQDKATDTALPPRHVSALQSELQQATQALTAAKKQVHEETRKAATHAQEVATFRRELAALQGELLAKDRGHAEALDALRAKLEAAKPAPAPRRPSFEDDGDAVHKSQLQAMTRRLLEKQEQLDGLRTRFASLEVRYNDLRAQRDAKVEDADMGRKRALPLYQTHRRNNGVMNAVGAIDRQLFIVGRFLRAYPAARVAAVGYLALLHVWVFVVLSFHTSHLTEELGHHHKATPSD
ncbi:hypothetical protein ACHHYP_12972 [Achlya hypogyna]|uniref:Golgin-84 n=1 Tax=Achlya hypogyna TaxID=1202772 RepID=A0A1V9YGA1_ACHHY|nr:hypothetical protein ACHHYP_12972 [Achlya hypogyna]